MSVSAIPQRSQKWYADWQHEGHVELFDQRACLSDRDLVRNFESFNDVRLLKARLEETKEISLLEVGCATGEFYRYLRIRSPKVRYTGIDLSEVAIRRAKEKYPEGRFTLSEPSGRIADTLRAIKGFSQPDIVYSKDVLHHQVDPSSFLSELLHIPSQALILRTRTRDIGETLFDPELSCQYHYRGWMPYIVFNLQMLIDQIRSEKPQSDLVVLRNHMILGGKENRFLPKDCYFPQTGTAETALGVFFQGSHPGQVQVEDRKESISGASLPSRVKRYVRRILERGRS